MSIILISDLSRDSTDWVLVSTTTYLPLDQRGTGPEDCENLQNMETEPTNSQSVVTSLYNDFIRLTVLTTN